MIKKSIFLLAVLLVIGLTLVQAQDESYWMNQMEQLGADLQAGKITQEEYTRRWIEIIEGQQAALQRQQQAMPTYTQAQLSRFEELLEQQINIQLRFNEGRISNAEATRLFAPVEREINELRVLNSGSAQAVQQIMAVSEAVKERWPGSLAGWPPMRGTEGVVDICGYGPFTQGTGTRASFTTYRGAMTSPVHSFDIYQTNANQTTFNDLRRQIEQATGKQLERLNNSNIYRMWVPDPDGGTGYHLDLILENNTLVFRIAKIHR